MKTRSAIVSFLGGVVAPIAAIAGSPNCGGPFAAPYSAATASWAAPFSQSAVYAAPAITYAQPTVYAQPVSVAPTTYLAAPTTTLVPQYSYVSAQPVTSFAMPASTFSTPVVANSASAQHANCGGPYSGSSAQAGELLAWIGVFRELQGLFGRPPADRPSPDRDSEIEGIKSRLSRIETHLGLSNSTGGDLTDQPSPPPGVQSQPAQPVHPVTQLMMDYQAARDQEMLQKMRNVLLDEKPAE